MAFVKLLLVAVTMLSMSASAFAGSSSHGNHHDYEYDSGLASSAANAGQSSQPVEYDILQLDELQVISQKKVLGMLSNWTNYQNKDLLKSIDSCVRDEAKLLKLQLLVNEKLSQHCLSHEYRASLQNLQTEIACAMNTARQCSTKGHYTNQREQYVLNLEQSAEHKLDNVQRLLTKWFTYLAVDCPESQCECQENKWKDQIAKHFNNFEVLICAIQAENFENEMKVEKVHNISQQLHKETLKVCADFESSTQDEGYSTKVALRQAYKFAREAKVVIKHDTKELKQDSRRLKSLTHKLNKISPKLIAIFETLDILKDCKHCDSRTSRSVSKLIKEVERAEKKYNQSIALESQIGDLIYGQYVLLNATKAEVKELQALISNSSCYKQHRSRKHNDDDCEDDDNYHRRNNDDDCDDNDYRKKSHGHHNNDKDSCSDCTFTFSPYVPFDEQTSNCDWEEKHRNYDDCPCGSNKYSNSSCTGNSCEDLLLRQKLECIQREIRRLLNEFEITETIIDYKLDILERNIKELHDDVSGCNADLNSCADRKLIEKCKKESD